MSTQVREWLNSHTEEERAALAASAGTSVGYLYQLSGGHRKASVELSARLNKASKGVLTLEGLRPDLHELLSQSKRRSKAA
ncbi:hypothetical protein ACI2KS_10170 [Pseudomonas sp. NPDC087358]|uniref:hypothetical protein n=1 Tax=Pseudomonas sp. NPDC087358 TaxID=3364439 RepID=UPI00384FC907